MDRSKHCISANSLYARPGPETAPIVVDVRHDADFIDADRRVVPAFHRSPDAAKQWRKDLPDEQPVVAHCFHGQEVGRGVVTALRLIGVEADSLEGSIDVAE